MAEAATGGRKILTKRNEINTRQSKQLRGYTRAGELSAPSTVEEFIFDSYWS
jgi:hypothetical protein